MILPLEAEQYININGLPKEDFLLFTFYAPEQFKNYKNTYCIIAENDVGVFIGLDELGEVYIIDSNFALEILQQNLVKSSFIARNICYG